MSERLMFSGVVCYGPMHDRQSRQVWVYEEREDKMTREGVEVRHYATVGLAGENREVRFDGTVADLVDKVERQARKGGAR